MVCAREAQQELAQALGVQATVEGRTWIAHRYSCSYVYADGKIGLSVQELSSWNETFAYFRGLGEQLGNTESLADLGQGAFRTDNGDVVVRKDWKVLLVDIGGLPNEFGNPPTSPSDVAYTVADVILACWAGD